MEEKFTTFLMGWLNMGMDERAAFLRPGLEDDWFC
jgi:hypothetical protein